MMNIKNLKVKFCETKFCLRNRKCDDRIEDLYGNHGKTPPSNPVPKWLKILTWISAISSLSGLISIFFVQKFIENAIEKELVIEPGTVVYDAWRGRGPEEELSEAPIFMKIYFFSILNPNETVKGLEKPDLLEMGPYTFREVQEKINVTLESANASLTYKVKKFWYFEPERSNGTLGDIVTSVNVPMIAAANKMKDNPWGLWMISSAFETIGSDLFVRKNVSQLLFDGYEDELLAMASMFGQTGDVPMDKFGWFYNRNGTSWADGTFEMHTGGDDISKVGEIISWNGLTRTHFEGECGEIRGSAEGFFPPKTEGEKVSIFSHETCRAIDFNKKSSKEMSSVPVNVYSLDETTFANGADYPPNACFSKDQSLPSGLLDTSGCKGESPAYISFPHFYLADPSYRENFSTGSFRPGSQEEFGSQFSIEPEMGVPLEFKFRLQINVKLQSVEGISGLDELAHERLFYPCIWFEIITELDADMIANIGMLNKLPAMVGTSIQVTLGLSVLTTAVCLLARLLISRREKGSDEESAKTSMSLSTPSMTAKGPNAMTTTTTSSLKDEDERSETNSSSASGGRNTAKDFDECKNKEETKSLTSNPR